MLEYAIDGHDGAAKTPILVGVQSELEHLGHVVHRVAIFHQANACLPGGEIYPFWADDITARRATTLLLELAEQARDEARRINASFLLFDRHWMTVMVEIVDRDIARLWTDFVPTFFIQAPPSKTMACDRFSHELPWTESVDQVRAYYDRYREIADRFAQHIRGTFRIEQKRDPLKPIIDSIVQSILQDGSDTRET